MTSTPHRPRGRPPHHAPALFAHPEVTLFISTRPHHVAPLKRFFTAAEIETWDQLLELTRQQGARARDAMRERYKGPTVAHGVSAARALLRQLTDRGVLNENVLSDLRTTGTISPIPISNVLQAGQEERILAAPHGPNTLRDQAVMVTLIDEGLRASELAKLTWENFYREPDGRWVVTFVGKMGKPARMRLKPRVMELALKLRRKGAPTSAPFIPKNSRGEPLTRQDIWSIVRRWGKAIGSPVTPHGLRATFISGVYARTRDVRKAQRMARHENLASTQRYLRLDVLDDEEG